MVCRLCHGAAPRMVIPRTRTHILLIPVNDESRYPNTLVFMYGRLGNILPPSAAAAATIRLSVEMSPTHQLLPPGTLPRARAARGTEQPEADVCGLFRVVSRNRQHTSR